jgi:hypothetical protein
MRKRATTSLGTPGAVGSACPGTRASSRARATGLTTILAAGAPVGEAAAAAAAAGGEPSTGGVASSAGESSCRCGGSAGLVGAAAGSAGRVGGAPGRNILSRPAGICQHYHDRPAGTRRAALQVGLYPIVTSRYSSATLYQVSHHIQSLFF